MGLKSLILLNKNSNVLYYNNSFLSALNYNRIIFFFFFITKLFLDYFNSFFFFSIILNIKKTVFNSNSYPLSKLLFFGKINFFLLQKWLIIRINSFNFKKKNFKPKTLKFIKYINFLKKKNIEL